MTSSNERNGLTFNQRLLSACSGALVTTFFMTPLDVVKIRLQAQSPSVHTHHMSHALNPLTCSKCTHFSYRNGLMEHTLPKSSPILDPVCKHGLSPPRLQGTFDAFFKIYRYEGLFSFYRGLTPTLLMAVPATVLYFNAYDEIKSYTKESGRALF